MGFLISMTSEHRAYYRHSTLSFILYDDFDLHDACSSDRIIGRHCELLLYNNAATEPIFLNYFNYIQIIV